VTLIQAWPQSGLDIGMVVKDAYDASWKVSDGGDAAHTEGPARTLESAPIWNSLDIPAGPAR
jgi:hypothetical protein